MASDRGVGLRIILGVGNEAVLGLGDLFAWAADDPATKVVTSYVETMRDVDGIGRGLDALRRRAQAGADLRAAGPLRGGAARDRRPHGRARREHRAAGRVARGARGRPRGRPRDDVRGRGPALAHAALRTAGVAAALQSGGACTLFAEAAGAAGLPLPGVRARDEARAPARALPSFASQNNPLDVTGQAAVETDMFVGALDGARARPVGRAGRVRRVPAAAARARRRGPIRSSPRPCDLQRPPAWSSRPCR